MDVPSAASEIGLLGLAGGIGEASRIAILNSARAKALGEAIPSMLLSGQIPEAISSVKGFNAAFPAVTRPALRAAASSIPIAALVLAIQAMRGKDGMSDSTKSVALGGSLGMLAGSAPAIAEHSLIRKMLTPNAININTDVFSKFKPVSHNLATMSIGGLLGALGGYRLYKALKSRSDAMSTDDQIAEAAMRIMEKSSEWTPMISTESMRRKLEAKAEREANIKNQRDVVQFQTATDRLRRFNDTMAGNDIVQALDMKRTVAMEDARERARKSTLTGAAVGGLAAGAAAAIVSPSKAWIPTLLAGAAGGGLAGGVYGSKYPRQTRSFYNDLDNYVKKQAGAYKGIRGGFMEYYHPKLREMVNSNRYKEMIKAKRNANKDMQKTVVSRPTLAKAVAGGLLGGGVLGFAASDLADGREKAASVGKKYPMEVGRLPAPINTNVRSGPEVGRIHRDISDAKILDKVKKTKWLGKSMIGAGLLGAGVLAGRASKSAPKNNIKQAELEIRKAIPHEKRANEVIKLLNQTQEYVNARRSGADLSKVAYGPMRTLQSAGELISRNPMALLGAIGLASLADPLAQMVSGLGKKVIDPFVEQHRFNAVMGLPGDPIMVPADAPNQLFVDPGLSREEREAAALRKAFDILHQYAPEMTINPEVTRIVLNGAIRANPEDIANRARSWASQDVSLAQGRSNLRGNIASSFAPAMSAIASGANSMKQRAISDEQIRKLKEEIDYVPVQGVEL